MRVFKHHLARATLANNAANARQGDIQPHGFWYLRRKKSKLHLAGAARLCVQGKPKDSCLRRMRLQIQMDELQP